MKCKPIHSMQDKFSFLVLYMGSSTYYVTPEKHFDQ